MLSKSKKYTKEELRERLLSPLSMIKSSYDFEKREESKNDKQDIFEFDLEQIKYSYEFERREAEANMINNIVEVSQGDNQSNLKFGSSS